MWWFVKKKHEDENSITYTYGMGSREQTGEVFFDKKTEKFTLIRLAENDLQTGVERFLYQHLYRVIKKEGSPSERLIAIG